MVVLGDDAPLVGLLPSFPARSTAPVLVRPDRNAKYFDLRSLGAVLGIGEAVIVGLLSLVGRRKVPTRASSCLPMQSNAAPMLNEIWSFRLPSVVKN